MTLPRWPSDLPRPDRQGFQVSVPDGRLATRPEAGPPRVRRRFSAAATPMQMTIRVDADQRARFERFWGEDLSRGSLPFLMPDWRFDGHGLRTGTGGGGLVTAAGGRLIIAAWVLVMFATDQAPAQTPEGVGWRIVASFSILP